MPHSAIMQTLGRRLQKPQTSKGRSSAASPLYSPISQLPTSFGHGPSLLLLGLHPGASVYNPPLLNPPISPPPGLASSCLAHLLIAPPSKRQTVPQDFLLYRSGSPCLPSPGSVYPALPIGQGEGHLLFATWCPDQNWSCNKSPWSSGVAQQAWSHPPPSLWPLPLQQDFPWWSLSPSPGSSWAPVEPPSVSSSYFLRWGGWAGVRASSYFAKSRVYATTCAGVAQWTDTLKLLYILGQIMYVEILHR